MSKIKNEDANKPGSSSSTNANANSDSSDDQSEKCPICLLPFRKQQVGSPSACDHCFCLECLLEWSKNINTCPVDRILFTTIVVRDHFDGKVIWYKFFLCYPIYIDSKILPQIVNFQKCFTNLLKIR